MLKAIRIKAESKTDVLDVPENMEWDWPSKQIGCDLIELISVGGLSEGCVMIVDDEGLMKENAKFNALATMIYGHSPIVGDALIMATEHGPVGADIVGLTDEQVSEIAKGIKKLITTRYM